MKPGKRLGGKPPRTGRPGRSRAPRPEGAGRGGEMGLLLVLAIGLFVVGGVAGFGWALDRQIRGGLLRQGATAERRADWVQLETLPAYVPQTFLAVVDPDFLTRGRLRRGASGTTVARELVRQVHLLPSSLGGEARELMMGPVLEQRASKRELLELYLNRVYLGEEQGHPVYGIYHAAQEYFEKEPSALTLGETATLAGLLLEPRIEDPERDVGAVGARRNEVLRVLLIGQLISESQYRAALEEPLGFQPGLDQLPVTRPLDFGRESEVIRLPPNLRPAPDSLAADSLSP